MRCFPVRVVCECVAGDDGAPGGGEQDGFSVKQTENFFWCATPSRSRGGSPGRNKFLNCGLLMRGETNNSLNPQANGKRDQRCLFFCVAQKARDRNVVINTGSHHPRSERKLPVDGISVVHVKFCELNQEIRSLNSSKLSRSSLILHVERTDTTAQACFLRLGEGHTKPCSSDHLNLVSATCPEHRSKVGASSL